jgi:hypothetical protein
MTQWGLEGFGSSHLNPNAVVAFVDGELSELASTRAQRHLAGCPLCAAETDKQRQVRGMVRQAEPPRASAGLLAVLREIPDCAALPDSLDGLAVSSDGKLMSAGRPAKSGARQSGPDQRCCGAADLEHAREPAGLDEQRPGGPAALLDEHHRGTRRAVQGAGAVVSGLVLGAVAFVAPNMVGSPARTAPPGSPARNAVPVSARTPAPTSSSTRTHRHRAPGTPGPRGRPQHSKVGGDATPPSAAARREPAAAARRMETVQALLPAPRAPVNESRHGRPQP